MSVKKKQQPNKQEVALRFIRENYLDFDRLRHDMISDLVQINMAAPGDPPAWRNITTADINDMVCTCAEEMNASVTDREIRAVLNSHAVPDVHPLREFVLSCPEYTPDQPDYIGALAAQVTVEGNEEAQNYWRICFTKWFLGMVASWLKDDAVNHQVLTLIGKQGIYKTTWLEHLLPPQLRAYGCKMASCMSLNKDERLRIAEYGLIALDEIDAMSPRELNIIKSVITASDTAERAAYKYNKERRIRLASFCASGNKEEFLTDVTGNRRWLPFKVLSIQPPQFTPILYEAVYAEALYMINMGYPYWFDQSDIQELEQHNENFRAQENEEQLIPVYFAIPSENNGKFLTTAEISEKLVSWGYIKKPMPLNRLGMVLRKAGFPEKRTSSKRGFIVRELSGEEINANRNIEARM